MRAEYPQIASKEAEKERFSPVVMRTRSDLVEGLNWPRNSQVHNLHSKGGQLAQSKLARHS